eukprot:TRINITY_DN42829_c0_g1_i1.p1 TRINITY_DN42829_c0_g1~~TRINITY_DN42829_c0_g1_i1.p1  ORF type:complete len:573 (+),score=44.17 TRINITY_DN42829_c0_g1_i1:33-1721(+)
MDGQGKRHWAATALLILACLGSVTAMSVGCLHCEKEPSPVVRNITGLGKVEGSIVNAEGILVEEYLGVPYAEWTGRWEPPGEAQPWEGTRFARVYGHTCMGSECETVPGDSEDCLFANVFLPHNATRADPYPVLLWIHGGGFTNGCSNDFAAEQAVASSIRGNIPTIIVTINYRLNVFGFLGSSNLQSPDGSTGNFGIQDQREAMRWVQKHIKSFNGDPQKVTIWGESAGAGSVSDHLVMKKSFNLYSSAILESGLGSIWAAQPLTNAEHTYNDVLNYTQCGDAECLKQMAATDLEKAASRLPSIPGGIFITWSPVIDGVELTEHPWKLFQSGDFNTDIKVLAGANRDEYAYFFLTDGTPKANATESDFKSLLSPFLPPNNTDEYMTTLIGLYQENQYEYPADRGGMDFWWWAAMRAKSDHEFTCPTRRTMRSLAAKDLTFGYFLVHPTETPTYMPGSGKGAFTVPHASDIPYTWNCSKLGTSCGFTNEAESQLASSINNIILTFADRGYLTPPFFPYNVTEDNLVVLDTAVAFNGTGLHTITHLRSPQCDFWDTVLEENDP